MVDRRKKRKDDRDEFEDFLNSIMKLFIESMNNMFGTGFPSPERRPVVANQFITPNLSRRKRDISIIHEKNKLRIFIDLRGAKEETINIKVRDKTLFVEAFTVDGYYKESLDLPFKPDKNKIEKSYYNGILEITLHRG